MWRGAGERRWDLAWLAFQQRRARAGERRWAVRVCLSLAAPRPHRIAIRPPATPRRFSFGTRALAHLVGHNLTSGPLYNPCRLQRMTCWASKRRIDRNPNLLSIYIYRVIDTTMRAFRLLVLGRRPLFMLLFDFDCFSIPVPIELFFSSVVRGLRCWIFLCEESASRRAV